MVSCRQVFSRITISGIEDILLTRPSSSVGSVALLRNRPSLHTVKAVNQSDLRFLSSTRYLSRLADSAASTTEVKSSTNDLPTDALGRVSVYHGQLKNQIRGLKFFSLSTSVMGLAAQPVIYQYAGESSIGASIALFGIVGFYTFVTPLLIHTMAKKYVIELLYNPKSDTYTAVTYNLINRRKELDFVVNDVIVPDVPGPFTTIHIKQVKGGAEQMTPLFIPPDSAAFSDPAHYGRLMGFDKPLNLHLNTDDVEKLEPTKKTA